MSGQKKHVARGSSLRATRRGQRVGLVAVVATASHAMAIPAAATVAGTWLGHTRV